ncbi:beta-2 adrenergic receptor isoform X3 [Hydra vulgaris]|uniref:Beta-2 adrenergic receptor isoform X3 n=2 Tax=Hydra vulgaris TaxID=6087 RepID=A0ABM4DJW2_HYDVU
MLNNSSNNMNITTQTSLPNEPNAYAAIASLFVLSTTTTTVNAGCLVIIRKSKKMLTRPSVHFIINILVVDLLQGMFVIPIYAIKKIKIQSRFWDNFVCDSFRFLYMITYYMSIFCVLLIALDRYIATAFIFKYRTLIKIKTVRIITIASWIYVTALCLIPFYKAPSQHITNQENDSCIYRPSNAWTITMLILNCFIPYLVILFFYSCIFKHIQNIENQSGRDRREGKSLSDNARIVLKIAFLVSICYAICWTPSVIYYVLGKFCPKYCFSKNFKNSTDRSNIEFAIKYIGFLNSLGAPMIYCLTVKEFRFRLLFLKKDSMKAVSTTCEAYANMSQI